MHTFLLQTFLWLVGCNDCVALGQSGPAACGPAIDQAVTRLGTPVLRGSINERAGDFLFDTGAQATFVSAKRLGVESGQWVYLDKLCFDETCFFRSLAYALDSPFSAASDDEINGVIGMDLLAFGLLTLRQGERVRFEIGGTPCRASQQIPFELDAFNRPVTHATFHQSVFSNVLLDTGGRYAALSASSSDVLPRSGFEVLRQETLCTLQGCEREAVVAAVSQVCVGSVCLANVATKFPVWDAIGASYFNAFEVTFDFAGRRLLFCDAPL